jgi:hypothetical protein
MGFRLDLQTEKLPMSMVPAFPIPPKTAFLRFVPIVRNKTSFENFSSEQ